MVASTSSGSCRTGASTGCAPAKTEPPHRSDTEPSATLRGMATRLVEASRSGSFLLELLYFAGWRLDVRDGDAPRVRATRDEIELEAASGVGSKTTCVCRAGGASGWSR